MNANVAHVEEQQQLIPMFPLSAEKTSADETTVTIEQATPTSREAGPRARLRRAYTRLAQLRRSLHLPHLSDNNLRIVFLFFITLIGLTSFTIALIVGSSIVQFKQQCPLYASFKFQTFAHTPTNWTVRIIPLTERFSSQSTCDFCTFYNVFTFIYCVMTGFFFVLFNGDSRIVTTNDQCLIIPWFPISVILGFFSLINASILTNGFLKFCSTLTSNDSHVTSCGQLNHIFFEQYPNVSSLFLYMLVAIVASWFQLAFFISIVTVLTIRLSSTFDWIRPDVEPVNGKPSGEHLQSMEETEN